MRGARCEGRDLWQVRLGMRAVAGGKICGGYVGKKVTLLGEGGPRDRNYNVTDDALKTAHVGSHTKLDRSYLFSCRHLDTNSDLLLRERPLSALIIASFSARHRLQGFVLLEQLSCALTI